MYVLTDEAKPMLKACHRIREYAERAEEILLRFGRLGYLGVE
jgi:hypothetical protein